MSEPIDTDWATVYRVLGRLSGRGGALKNQVAAEMCGVKPATLSNWRSTKNPKVPGAATARLAANVVAEHLGPEDAEELLGAWDRLRSTRDEHTREAQRYGAKLSNIAEAARGREPDAMVQLRLAVIADGNVFPSMASRLSARTEQDDPQAASHWRLASYSTGDRMPPYVRRTIHGDLFDRLGGGDAGTLVIISGEPRSGKTRLAAEVVNDHPTLRARPLHEIPRRTDHNDTLANYGQALRAAKHHLDQPPVVFIDNLHEHVRNPSTGMDRHSPLAGLLREVLRCGVVVATTHPWLLTNAPETVGITEADQAWLDDHAVALGAELDDDESAEAAWRLPDVVVAEGRLGETLGSIELLDRLVDEAMSPIGDRLRAAVICGLFDEYLFSFDRPTVDDIVHAAQPYLDDVVATQTDLYEAINWLFRPVAGSMTVAIVEKTSDGRLLIDDRLAARRLPSHDTKRRQVAPAEASTAGRRLYSALDITGAEDCGRQAADEGHAGAKYNLGLLLHELGRVAEAEDWWRQAADEGHAGAKYNLGLLLKQLGRVDEAEDLWRQAADEGHAGAKNNLGLLLKQLGRVDEAEDLWRQAADEGHAGAKNNLGLLLKQLGRVDEAEDWWRQAADDQ